MARAYGISIHAATCVDGRDRKQLERLCQYISRPALAQDRLQLLDDGRVRYDMTEANLGRRHSGHCARTIRLHRPALCPGATTVLQPHETSRRVCTQCQASCSSRCRQSSCCKRATAIGAVHIRQKQHHAATRCSMFDVKPANDASSAKPGRHSPPVGATSQTHVRRRRARVSQMFSKDETRANGHNAIGHPKGVRQSWPGRHAAAERRPSYLLLCVLGCP